MTGIVFSPEWEGLIDSQSLVKRIMSETFRRSHEFEGSLTNTLSKLYSLI
jgi:hypothetical protein